MSGGWRDRPLADLLARHGLSDVPERPFDHDGWSGATFTILERAAGERFVLKRDSLARDWIARATLDVGLREAMLVDVLTASPTSPSPGGLRIPYLGAAADGDGSAVLMPDLSGELLAWERPGYGRGLDDEVVDRALDAIAGLHADTRWASTGDEARLPWTPLRERLRLLSRRSADGYRRAGNPVGERFLEGWGAFDRQATRAARELVQALDADPDPLLTALGRLPAVGLHGDLKLANVAMWADGGVGFIDWQMVCRAPIAVELGWLLVSNSAVLPAEPSAVLERYLRSLGGRLAAEDVLGDRAAQVDLAWIIGLLLRGWRKGLDAEADVRLASGVTAADDLAMWSDRAVEAAGRRLT